MNGKILLTIFGKFNNENLNKPHNLFHLRSLYPNSLQPEKPK